MRMHPSEQYYITRIGPRGTKRKSDTQVIFNSKIKPEESRGMCSTWEGGRCSIWLEGN